MPWASGRTSVPVLCYHNLGGNGVPRDLFLAQMRRLARSGIQALSLARLMAFVAGEPLSGPGVVITFDDGFRDLYTFAGPVLAELGLQGVAFVVNDRLRPHDEPGLDNEIVAHAAHQAFLEQGDRSAWCSARELARLADQGVLEIGGHSFYHAQGPLSGKRLTTTPDHWTYTPWRGQGQGAPPLGPALAGPLWLEDQGRLETETEFAARAEKELTDCRLGLEAATGHAVQALAWPWGRFHALGLAAARRAGFLACFTLERGPLAQGADPMRLPRLEVRRNKGLAWFCARLAVYSWRIPAGIYSGLRL